MEKKPKKEESKHTQSRNPVKNKAPILETRKKSILEVDAPRALITDKPKSKKDIELINFALNKHFIFTSLPEENRSLLIERMKHYALNPQETVFEQNQTGNNFFVIIFGKLEVIINGKKVNTLEAKDSFGELSLLHNTPRSATIKTIEKSALWGLDRNTFRTALETLNARNYQENSQFIETVPLFQILTNFQKDALLSCLSSLKFRMGEKVVNEGDPGDLFYLIKEGIVSCKIKGKEIRQMTRGEFFGEQALLYNNVRTATITAITDLKCVAIGRERLTKVLGNQLQHIIYQNSKRIGLEKSEVLNQLNPIQVNNVLNSLEVKTYTKGQVVVPAGTIKGSKMWMVLKGNVVDRRNVVIGDVFSCIGDVELTQNMKDDCFDEGFSEGDSAVAILTREEFLKIIGGNFAQIVSNNAAFFALQKVQVLKNLSRDRFLALAEAISLQSYENGDTIVQQNSLGDSFFIIKSGKVDVIRDGLKIRTITKNDYFGERSILNNELRTATVIAQGKVTCFVMNQADFKRIIDDNMKNLLSKRIQLQDDNIVLSNLFIIKLLGKGMFGNVFLAARKDRQALYALKTIHRSKIEKYEIHENLVLERRILLQLDHIFILKLVKTFKDSKRIYFLTEFVRGMDLFDVLRELNLVSDRDSKFYMSCMILILEHLHDRDIIYRDLKPENVMVDEDGYLKLIDFGSAKIVNGRTYTIAGTPHYMAPEVITGKGYGVAADYWSLGVMLYEFVSGGVPFGENEKDPYAIYTQVLERKIVYPKFVDSRLPAKAVIDQLMQKNPALRTGGSIENLKAHPWFGTIDWVIFIQDSMISKSVQPPFVPETSGFAKEYEYMQRSGKNYDEVISLEENNDLGPSKPKKTINKNNDWDEEF